jgi:eukaryotic-like serine/threonine-protein kinase
MAATQLTSPERYELIERLAVGGMAEVFRAVAYGAHGFEKALAIKRILPELARDPEFENRFIAEAKLAVKLSHANVVQVLDFGRMGGTLFIAMELVDGLDLAALLRRYKDRGQLLPIPAALHISIEIARGLDFAHQHGVVHRDVSPSNILISRAGEVKIADFGIALAARDRRAQAADGRRIMGKWRYMSPEQGAGEPVEIHSDIFSAAAVWFELFTGDKLFPGEDADTIIRHIATMAIPKASERRAGLPSRLDELLCAALARDPAKRPEAGALLRGLVEVSYGSSIVASALDVKAAVSEALAGETASAEEGADTAGRGLDDLIREQLGTVDGRLADDEGRRTAVAPPPADAFAVTAPADKTPDRNLDTATFVRLGVDERGATRWEVDHETVAAAPRALREGRGSAALDTTPVEPLRAGIRRRVLLFGLAAALLGGGAAVAWTLGRTAGANGVARADAGAADPTRSELATLVIDSNPTGARVAVDGRSLPGRTLTSVEVAPGTSHRVAVELEGYEPWLDEVTANPAERVRVVASLVAAHASLRVTTRPPGALVELDGAAIGTTPLTRGDLRPGAGRTLLISKPDFKPISLQIDLAAGTPVDIDRTLESAIVYGRITIHIKDGWANVSLGGKSVGRVPGILKLPVGAQRLRLYNPYSKKSKLVTVDVVAGRTNYYEFAL